MERSKGPRAPGPRGLDSEPREGGGRLGEEAALGADAACPQRLPGTAVPWGQQNLAPPRQDTQRADSLEIDPPKTEPR